MLEATRDSKPPKISFCVPTFNRGKPLGATLDNIIYQATTDCEIVDLDAGSSDNTDEVVSARAARFARLRYLKQAVPGGVVCSIDEVVTLASGDFCWLLSSKDMLKPVPAAPIRGHTSGLLLRCKCWYFTWNLFSGPASLDIGAR